jgi:hypothetical protein
MTGDKKHAKDRQTTWVVYDSVTPGEQLIPSGLMGDVAIQVAE